MARAKDAGEILITTIQEAIDKGVMKDLVLEVAAPIQFQAKRIKDGQYRTVSMSRGEELTPSGIRFGKRGDSIIFEFTRIEPSDDYSQFELNDQKVWTAFPDLEGLVIRALGYEEYDTDEVRVRFAQIKGQFLVEAAANEAKRIEEEKAAAEKKTKSHYDDHPMFGTWG